MQSCLQNTTLLPTQNCKVSSNQDRVTWLWQWKWDRWSGKDFFGKIINPVDDNSSYLIGLLMLLQLWLLSLLLLLTLDKGVGRCLLLFSPSSPNYTQKWENKKRNHLEAGTQMDEWKLTYPKLNLERSVGKVKKKWIYVHNFIPSSKTQE